MRKYFVRIVYYRIKRDSWGQAQRIRVDYFEVFESNNDIEALDIAKGIRNKIKGNEYSEYIDNYSLHVSEPYIDSINFGELLEGLEHLG